MGCLISCLPNQYRQGKVLYEQHCANCHMSNGAGLMALYPPLIDSDYLLQNQSSFACIVRHGLQDTIEVNGVEFSTPMEGISRLNAVEIANIFNFIMCNWYPDCDPKTDDEILADLSRCGSLEGDKVEE